MGIKMEQLPSDMTLAALTARCTQEMGKFSRKEPGDDRYCIEIFRRAIELRDADAWTALKHLFSPSMRRWLRQHTSRETALRYNSEDGYIDDSFTRFWLSVHKHTLSFTTVAAALAYLHRCTHSTLMEALRSYARPNLEQLPDYGHPEEPLFEDHYDAGELWAVIRTLLQGEKEILAAHFLYFCNLKPRQIIELYPQYFTNVGELYRLHRNIHEKITRNIDKIRWKMSDGESK